MNGIKLGDVALMFHEWNISVNSPNLVPFIIFIIIKVLSTHMTAEPACAQAEAPKTPWINFPDT